MRGVVRRRLSSAGVQAVTRMIGAGTIEDVAVPALPKEYAMHYPPRTVPFAERHVDLLEDVFRDLKSVKKREQDLLTEPAPDPEHARARWPDRPEVRELLQRSDLAIGDVIEPRRPDPYDAAAGPDQFRDVTPPLPGTVPAHANLVDIGFTDFGALLDMDFQSEFADSKWLGVDLCPFNCAKTRVMLEMMRVKHCTGQEIMEVYINSVWSVKTVYLFAEAVYRLLNSPAQPVEKSVQSILRAWACAVDALHKVSVTSAVRRLDDRSDFHRVCGDVCHLPTAPDRASCLRALLTGDYVGAGMGDDSTRVGSIVFFSNPAILQATMTFSTPLSAHASFGPGPSGIVERTVAALKAKIDRLCTRIECGQVEAMVKCAPVAGAVQAIRSLQPHRISWNGVQEYIQIDEFHQMAREMSFHGPGTEHHFVSRQWPKSIFGADIYDIAVDHRSALLQEGRDLLARLFKAARLSSEPIIDPTRLANAVLARRFARTYVDYFVASAGRDCAAQGDISIVPPLPFSVSPSIICFALTYRNKPSS
ncbi:hypothetical protein PBRA_000981 [Plasmodiophora brassicae]|uniref:Uncharacterized protein n=1 Tax=Plasmodiophora brassicae TaxID=37360 RepID=A0A0G4IRC1_PLABS|nr:hypothetical protein PBRA_000981 [Plasmodiophora brassicae]